MDMLIMDLRAFGGGFFPEAESLTGLFHRPRTGRAAARHHGPHRGGR